MWPMRVLHVLVFHTSFAMHEVTMEIKPWEYLTCAVLLVRESKHIHHIHVLRQKSSTAIHIVELCCELINTGITQTKTTKET